MKQVDPDLYNESFLPGKGQENDLLGEIDFSKILMVTIRSLPYVIGLFIICLSSCFLYLRYTKPVYQSSSVLKLESKNDAVVLGLDPLRDMGNSSGKRSLSGEIEIIKSNLVFEKVLEKLDLNTSYYLVGNLMNEERFRSSPFEVEVKNIQDQFKDFKFDIKIIDTNKLAFSFKTPDGKSFNKDISFNQPVSYPGFEFVFHRTPDLSKQLLGLSFYFTVNSRAGLINYLASNLKVDVLNPDANTLQVSFKDYTPTKAQAIVKTIDSVYLEQTLETKSKTQEQTLTFLNATLENTEQKLAQSELSLEHFMKRNKVVNVRSEVSRILERISELDRNKMEKRLKLALLNELKEIVVSGKDVKAFTPALAEINDPQLGAFITDLTNLQHEKTLALTRSKENTYVIKSLNISLENLKANILDAINQNKKLLYQQIEEVDRQALEMESTFLALPEKETEYTRIKRFYNLYEKFYLLLMEKKAEYGIAKAGMVPNFVILSPASLPSSPISPNNSLIYFSGTAAAFLISFLLILARYIFHNTISSEKEVEKLTPAPILGGVPVYEKDEMDFSRLVVDNAPKSALSEAFRSIRTNLEFICPDKKTRIITVTSSTSGEGKTFVAANLAGVIALSGQKVVVLDLDMRKPKVHLAFHGQNALGMSTILIGKSKLNTCIQKTTIESLDFIAAGPTPPNPSELIMRGQLDELLNNLKEQYDVILIDSPPVGLVTDGVLIMKKADIPLYIIRANYSKKSVKNVINKLMTSTGFRNISIIINALDRPATYGYGYGYGYGNGYGYYENEEKEKKIFKKVKKLFAG